MNMFAWLALGHLVGDWLLQNDWMAKGKRQGLVTAPGIAHFTIYTLVTLAALGLSGLQWQDAMMFAVSATIIFVSHWLTDATDIVDLWMRSLRQTHTPMMRIMVDQTLHLLVLGILAAWLDQAH
jgi:hypothetical protein